MSPLTSGCCVAGRCPHPAPPWQPLLLSGWALLQKMIVLVRRRMHIEAIHASAAKSFRRKTTGINIFKLMNFISKYNTRAH